MAVITITDHPAFSFLAWGHSPNPLPDDGLSQNACWPNAKAPQDPGFALLEADELNKRKWGPSNNRKRPYDYKKGYNPPQNGV